MDADSLHDSLRYPLGNSLLEVSYTDIVMMNVDVIVSSDDTDLSMSGGTGSVAGSIRLAGGEGIFQEAQRHRPAKLGEVVVTSGGNLPARKVFHAVVLDKSLGKEHTNAQVITSAVRKCLELCTIHKVRSIAFPALATGTARLAPEQSAAAIIVEICTQLISRPEIERVHIALHPSRWSDVAPRFYWQIQQYLTLMQTLLRGERALADLSNFKTSGTPATIDLDRKRLAAVREDLDEGMRSRGVAEFNAQVATRVSETVASTFAEIDTKLADGIGKSGGGQNVTRLQAERLNILIGQAQAERARLEAEDLREGGTTEDRKKRKGFYLAKEAEYARELASLVSTSRPLVLSLHGIRTRGKWQKEINLPLNEAGFYHEPVDYGYFGLIRFLLPCFRRGCVKKFRDAYQRVGAKTTTGHPSLIAHSLGSYIATHAIADYDLRFDQVILCGAIVKENYPWEKVCRAGFVTRVLNDHGRQDIWARIARVAVSDAGQSGFKGFDDDAGGRVINRNHAKFGHSDYFYEKNYRDNWIPFLKGDNPSELSAIEPAGTNWRFLVFMVILTTSLAVIAYLLIW